MEYFCTYCNTLHRAFSDANYCSNNGDEISRVRSNAYYFQSNNLNSGDHISRLSIRTINKGFQTHIINGEEFLLDKEEFLVVPEGASFESHIKTNNPIEGLLVAFSSDDIEAFNYWNNSSEDELLDNPFDLKSLTAPISAISLQKNKEVYENATKIQNAIKNGLNRSLYYEEHFFNLLGAVIKNLYQQSQKIKALSAKKKSTKKEIYKRVSLAKTWMDCNLDKNLELQTLSQISAMSPFHFLRSFKGIYNKSPYQYIKQKRIEKAKFLLHDTNYSIDDILMEIGLENKSSFLRCFKKSTGFTTSQYRSLTTQ